MAELNMGILLDIVDDEWMRDTLPHDDVSIPPQMATRTDDVEDTNQENQPFEGDVWRDLALDTLSVRQPDNTSDPGIELDGCNEDTIKYKQALLDKIEEFALRIYALINGGKRGLRKQSIGLICTRFEAHLNRLGLGPFCHGFLQTCTVDCFGKSDRS